MDAITLALNISIWRASPISSHAIHTTQKHTPRDKNKKKKKTESGWQRRKNPLPPRLIHGSHLSMQQTKKQARTTRTPREPLDSREQSKILRESERGNKKKKTETLEICILWYVHR
jgi:hypothetical protein